MSASPKDQRWIYLKLSCQLCSSEDSGTALLSVFYITVLSAFHSSLRNYLVKAGAVHVLRRDADSLTPWQSERIQCLHAAVLRAIACLEDENTCCAFEKFTSGSLPAILQHDE